MAAVAETLGGLNNAEEGVPIPKGGDSSPPKKTFKKRSANQISTEGGGGGGNGVDENHHQHHQGGEGGGEGNGSGGLAERSAAVVAAGVTAEQGEGIGGGDGGEEPKRKRFKKRGGPQGRGGGGGGGRGRGRGGGRGRGAGGEPRMTPAARYDRLLGIVTNREELRPGSEQPSNVILARIAEGIFPVTIDALYTLFSLYGPVQKIVMFNKGAGNQALIQYPDVVSAMTAYEQVDNRNMYTDSNLIRVGFSNLTDIIVRANTDKSWDYTKEKGAKAKSSTSTDDSKAAAATTAEGAAAAGAGTAAAPVAGPVDAGLKASLRERIIAEMPNDWNKPLPGTDTCVLVVQGLNMEMVGAEALAALFGVYGDVVKIKMLPEQESALIQLEKPVQAYCAKWLLDASPLGGRIIKVKPSMQEAIRDAQAQDFKDFPLHGYRKVPSPRDPAYLSNIVEPTNILRVANIDWDQGEQTFRGVLTQQDGVIDVTRVTSSNDSPALVQFQSIEAAVHACILLHNQDVEGKVLYVTFSDAIPGF